MLSRLRRRSPQHAEGPGPTPSAAERAAGEFARRDRRAENTMHQGTVATRVLAAALMLSLGLNMGLVALALYMTPQRSAVPYLLTVSPHTAQVVEVEPINPTAPIATLIVESELARYVRERHMVLDQAAMLRRWRSRHSFIASHSAQDVYREFLVESEPLLERTERQSWKREVTVDAIAQIDTWQWQVHFTTEDHLLAHPQPEEQEIWTAHIKIAPLRYSDNPTRDEIRRNPLRYVVASYTVTRRPTMSTEG